MKAFCFATKASGAKNIEFDNPCKAVLLDASIYLGILILAEIEQFRLQTALSGDSRLTDMNRFQSDLKQC